MGRLAPRALAMAMCPNCGSDAAALGDFDLIDIEDEDNDTWYAHIMCGSCSTWRYIEAREAEFQAWENICLIGYAEVIAREAERLAAHNFKDWCATFIVALKHDIILPEDF